MQDAQPVQKDKNAKKNRVILLNYKKDLEKGLADASFRSKRIKELMTRPSALGWPEKKQKKMQRRLKSAESEIQQSVLYIDQIDNELQKLQE